MRAAVRFLDAPNACVQNVGYDQDIGFAVAGITNVAAPVSQKTLTAVMIQYLRAPGYQSAGEYCGKPPVSGQFTLSEIIRKSPCASL